MTEIDVYPADPTRTSSRLRVISGAMHYFRTHPQQWSHRLQSLRAMGLTTVETYLAWNIHEPERGDWRRLDEITAFLDCAHAEGLTTIVRPGPYICAEWDNGGLPAWLTHQAGRRVRTADPSYLEACTRYLEKVVPLFANHPSLVLVQVENEYGSFGTDAKYLAALTDTLRRCGVTVPLVTSDGASDMGLTGGSIPGVAATVNFGSRATESFAKLKEHRPEEQPFCMEFWNGWFDHWGFPRVRRSASDATAALTEILEQDGSVNLYMAHGGTNFGVGAGANYHVLDGALSYRPVVTSYDYDAPLDERGAPTEKFYAFQEVLQRFGGGKDGVLPEMPPTVAPQTVRLTRVAPVDFTPAGEHAVPPSFEELGLSHGLVKYETQVPGPRVPSSLTLSGVRDRAHVYHDGVLLGVVDRENPQPLPEIGGPSKIAVVVESMGRANFGPYLGETKGIDSLRQDMQYLHGFHVSTHPLPELGPLTWHPLENDTVTSGMHYYGGDFSITEQADAYLEVSGGKGYVWVNGFSLGRYWNRGPQVRLYVPWPVLVAGENSVTILELDALTAASVTLHPEPLLGD